MDAFTESVIEPICR